MKKTRLLEIIREEISAVLKEGEAEEKAAKMAAVKATDLEIKALQKKKAELMKTGVAETQLEEDLLNETPIYDVTDMEGFKSTLDKFRDENTSKSKALNLLLTKLEDEGTVDTNQLSKDMGVDTATFNNQEIRKFLNRPEDEFFENPKTGKELPDFTPFLTKSDKKRGKIAGEKAEKEPKVKTEPKVTEPKATETDKASTMASKTPQLDKLAGNQDTLLKTQKDVKDKMQTLAKQLSGLEGAKRDKVVDELKKLNKLNGELQTKIDKLF